MERRQRRSRERDRDRKIFSGSAIEHQLIVIDGFIFTAPYQRRKASENCMSTNLIIARDN